ncbi:MAG: hypothetical protein EOO54_30000 [Haliea sp.]|nr:MAG: hypothetical protein EOO54_30000 [Haliea sp.]
MQAGSAFDATGRALVLADTGTAPEIGAQVDLTLRYVFDGQDIALACQGEVIGVECHGEGYHVAVRLRPPLFTEEDLACLR